MATPSTPTHTRHEFHYLFGKISITIIKRSGKFWPLLSFHATAIILNYTQKSLTIRLYGCEVLYKVLNVCKGSGSSSSSNAISATEIGDHCVRVISSIRYSQNAFTTLVFPVNHSFKLSYNVIPLPTSSSTVYFDSQSKVLQTFMSIHRSGSERKTILFGIS